MDALADVACAARGEPPVLAAEVEQRVVLPCRHARRDDAADEDAVVAAAVRFFEPAVEPGEPACEHGHPGEQRAVGDIFEAGVGAWCAPGKGLGELLLATAQDGHGERAAGLDRAQSSWLSAWMQTSTSGGSSDSRLKALTVMPR